MYPAGIEFRSPLVASRHLNHYRNIFNPIVFTISVLLYTIKSWDNSQVEPGTIPRLNLGKIPAIAGKTKLGQNPAIAGKKPCYSRDLSGAYISLL